jgi:hypothetical protein
MSDEETKQERDTLLERVRSTDTSFEGFGWMIPREASYFHFTHVDKSCSHIPEVEKEMGHTYCFKCGIKIWRTLRYGLKPGCQSSEFVLGDGSYGPDAKDPLYVYHPEDKCLIPGSDNFCEGPDPKTVAAHKEETRAILIASGIPIKSSLQDKGPGAVYGLIRTWRDNDGGC